IHGAPLASSGRPRHRRRPKISRRRRSSPSRRTPTRCGWRPKLPEAVHHSAALAHQFDDLEQQKEAATLGMWMFLVTEVLFFGGLFLVYTVYRSLYPMEFAASSRELVVWAGTTNPFVLITSSLTMALAVHAAQLGQRRVVLTFLALTMVLGCAFLGIKAF